MLGKRYRDDGKSINYLSAIQRQTRDQIITKIQSKFYRLEKVDCCICGSSDEDFELLSEKDRYGLYHHVVICRNCGLIQNNPRLTPDALNEFYGTEYRPLYSGGQQANDDQFQNAYKRGRSIYTYLVEAGLWEQLPETPYVVEIGCGSGGILKYFQDHGCNVLGVDLNADYLKYGIKHAGLNLLNGNIDTVLEKSKQSSSQPVNIIIYSHVLEHISDVVEELGKIESVMSPDTLLYIEVPGVKYLKTYGYDFLRSLQNAHVYYFSLSTLSNLLRKHGFELVAGTEFVRAVYRRSREDSTTPVSYINDYRATMRYLRLVETARYWKYSQAKYNARMRLFDILQTLGIYDTVRNIYRRIF